MEGITTVYKRGCNPYFPVKFRVLASDSLGVRSLATSVDAGGVKILIDPSAALGPRRYGLPPHELEEQALAYATDLIRREVEGADIVVFTHYHWDHYDPGLPLEGKTLFVKDPKNNINLSQRKRAALLEYEAIPADGKRFDIGPEEIVFSPPLPHGPEGTKLGYVIAVKIGDLLFSSDIQGPVSEGAAEWIIEQNPKTIIMDGPPTYFLGYRFSVDSRDAALRNLERIMEKTDVREIILDHHLTRDLKREENFPIYAKGEEYGVKIKTAAEHRDLDNLFLEAWRKELWKGEKEIDPNIVRRVYNE